MSDALTIKRDRFKRLAEKRVTRAIRELRLVGNLANRGNYSYDEKEAEKIVRAIEQEVRALRRRFDSGASNSDVEFKL